jgi:phosphate/sulfate permease
VSASSYSGMPISGTHTVVGALLGTGIAGVGMAYVNFT